MPALMRKFLFLSILGLLTYCGEKQQAIFEVPSREPGMPDSLTLDMIERVRKAVAKIDVLDVDYILNKKKVELMQKSLESATGTQKIGLTFGYALELLNSGDTKKAIETLEEVVTEVEKGDFAKKENLIFTLKKQLAISYMRQAEQENCIANHNDESCIIPISPKAQHVLREGAEQSIKCLNEVLAMHPDAECQYLLNVTHMTLGQYPDEVPDEYLLPEKYFESAAAFPRFIDIGMHLGVDMDAGAGGTCIDDFNNDGFLDIMASSWGFEDQIRYFQNDQKGGFVEHTDSVGLVGVTGGLNLRHADYNNDGHLDFMILRGAWLQEYGRIPNSLFRNNGDGTFTDVTVSAGLYSMHPTQTAVWADFNLDGWLDLFIANESIQKDPHPVELYLNLGDGTFREISKEAGIDPRGYYKGVAVGDVNNDRYPDLYLSNLTGRNLLYINQGESDPKFVSDTRAGVSGPERTFPTWMFDFDQDGWDDLFVSGYASREESPAKLMMDVARDKPTSLTPVLYRNLGDGTFEDISKQAGLSEPASTMGCNFGDLDNDGYLDFYLSTGDPEYFSIVPNKMYRNDAGKAYQDVTYTGGFGHIQKGHAIGFGDIDRDGDQDVYTVLGGAFEGDNYRNLLYENPIDNQNSWINIKLVGVESNQSAIGTKLILTFDDGGKERKIHHNVGMDASFGGNSLLSELGLGKAEVIKRLEVLWPYENMSVSVFENVSVNQHIQITEGSEEVKPLDWTPVPFRKMGMHGHHHASSRISNSSGFSSEMKGIIQFLESQGYSSDTTMRSDSLHFVSYDSTFNEVEQIKYSSDRFKSARFKKTVPVSDNFYPRFGIHEILFASSSEAKVAINRLNRIINSPDAINDKTYDYLISNENHLIYVQCNVKGFEKIVLEYKDEFLSIVSQNHN